MSTHTFDVTARPAIKPGDRLGLALFVAAVLHAFIIFGISFTPGDKAVIQPPPALEVILVQNHNTEEPDQADYLSQYNQTGGGESETRERPSDAFTAANEAPTDGIALEQLQAGSPEQQSSEQTPVLTQRDNDQQVLQSETAQVVEPDPQPADKTSKYDLEIARLTAELNNAREAYAKRPRKMVLTANTKAYAPAQYMHEWVAQVERMGNLNYPADAKIRNLEGFLMLEVEVRADGTVVETKLLRSSGSRILDSAARKIVELSAPFPPFPAELRELADHLEIVRTWKFNENALVTE